jgi:hypothetical protein
MKFKKDLTSLFRSSWAEYAYLFDEAKGVWTYKDLRGNEATVSKKGFKPLK